MSERMYTEQEAHSLAVDAATAALERFAAQRPIPSTMSTAEAAEVLGVSVRTVARMKLRRNSAGRIPYEVVLEARAAR